MQQYDIMIAGVVIRFIYLNHVNISPFAAQSFLITEANPHIFIEISVEDNVERFQLINPEVTTISWEMQKNEEGKKFNMYDKNDVVATLFVNHRYTHARLCIRSGDMHDIIPPLFTFFPVFSGFLLYNKIGFLFHGAMVEMEGNCFVLTGASGAGKSTLSQLIQEMGYAKWGDDRLIFTIDKNENVSYCHSTPFDLKIQSWTNKSCKLSAVIRLSHSQDGRNHLKKNDEANEINKLILSNFIPFFEQRELAEHFVLYKKIFHNVPIYDYAFIPNADSVRELKNMLIKGDEC